MKINTRSTDLKPEHKNMVELIELKIRALKLAQKQSQAAKFDIE